MPQPCVNHVSSMLFYAVSGLVDTWMTHGSGHFDAFTPGISEAHPFFERTAFAAMYFYAADLKKEYEKKAMPGRTAYNMAFRDFLKAPVVKGIDVLNYKGAPGSTIVIKAKDDFRVAEDLRKGQGNECFPHQH